jgi:hypothetical protein
MNLNPVCFCGHVAIEHELPGDGCEECECTQFGLADIKEMTCNHCGQRATLEARRKDVPGVVAHRCNTHGSEMLRVSEKRPHEGWSFVFLPGWEAI